LENKFWNWPKRAPTPITLDTNNDLHLEFVSNYAKLLALVLDLDFTFDSQHIKNVSDQIKLPEFVPKIRSILDEKTDEEK
jgi:hypothetical protein